MQYTGPRNTDLDCVLQGIGRNNKELEATLLKNANPMKPPFRANVETGRHFCPDLLSDLQGCLLLIKPILNFNGRGRFHLNVWHKDISLEAGPCFKCSGAMWVPGHRTGQRRSEAMRERSIPHEAACG
ncbi:uncharacterized protein LOC144306209 [Canis aureus]